MRRYSEAAWERAMKVQEVILRAGEADQLVAGGGDHRDLGSQPTAVEGALREGGI